VSRALLVVSLLAGACSFDGSGLGVATQPGELEAPDAAPASPDAAPAPSPCDRPEPSLAACYRFEVLTAPVQPHDDSGNRNHGVATGVGFVAGRPGAGQAMVTSAASSVRIPDSESLDPAAALTLEAWIRPTALPVSGRAGLLDNNGQYGLFVASSGEVRCAVGSNVLAGLHVQTGTWTHVACSFDGETIALFQDGRLTVSADSDEKLITSRSDGLTLGHNSPDGDPFDGALDDVHIWSTARSPAQICAAAGATGC
jgi:hypothetical protein